MSKNIDSFVPAWQGELVPDSRLLDFEEKWTSFHTPRGRLMSCAHRGDRNEAYSLKIRLRDLSVQF